MKQVAFKIATVWLVVFSVNIAIVKATAIGPVVLTISAKHGWGVHSFDLIVFPIALTGLIITVMLLLNVKKSFR